MFELIPFGRNNNLMGRDDFINKFFDGFFQENIFSPTLMAGQGFRVDLKETENSYIVEADLAGVKKEDISIDYENNHLTIKAKRNETVEDTKNNYVRKERRYGEFVRSFYVDNINENTIDASFKEGVLTVTLEKRQKGMDKKTRIDIH
ncbi:MAG: Hsp20/alpha crystallin family protein [Bacillota bacterium]|nr:Hsp20/alpha crystallin family protein [Bacillota bacterium]